MSAAEADLPPIMGPERRILAVGDSLFAGYGLTANEAYPTRLEAALRAKGINARVTNAGVSGDTSAAGAQRFAFVLDAQNPKPDLVIVEFGGNDILRGISPAETRKNIDAMLAEATKRGVKVVLMGMLAPPNLGADFRKQFEPIYPELAKKHGATLVPFFLDGLVGKPELVQADNIHPNAKGVEEIVKRTAGTVGEAVK
ncbi:arylesterase [Novosphingobium sp. TH158]|uniref:arylesterase n=1 Tax=Novosphingobium sp. TH158 TaxID=2067455 RepID=UPI0020B15873|nr:arylesterase [Novosphingobium sp. TH158]